MRQIDTGSFYDNMGIKIFYDLVLLTDKFGLVGSNGQQKL